MAALAKPALRRLADREPHAAGGVSACSPPRCSARLPDRHLERAQRLPGPPARHRFLQRLRRRNLGARRPGRGAVRSRALSTRASRAIFGAAHAVLRLALSALLPRSSRRSWRCCPMLRWRSGRRDLGLCAASAVLALSGWREQSAPSSRAPPARSPTIGEAGCGSCSPSPSRRCSSTSATATTASSPPRCSAARWCCSTSGRSSPASCSACSPTSRSSAC